MEIDKQLEGKIRQEAVIWFLAASETPLNEVDKRQIRQMISFTKYILESFVEDVLP